MVQVPESRELIRQKPSQTEFILTLGLILSIKTRPLRLGEKNSVSKAPLKKDCSEFSRFPFSSDSDLYVIAPWN